MVKTSKENKVQYVAPKAKAFEVRVRKGVLDGSLTSPQNEEFGDQENWGGSNGWS